MTNETVIIPHQLIKARKSLGLERGEVAEKLGIDVKILTEWEEGISEPTIEQLWSLAELYQRSTDYFLRQVPALPEHLSFRLERRKAMRDLPPEVRKVIVRFDELCRAEAELEEAIGRPHKVFIKKVSGGYNPKELAKAERKRLGLGEQPIRDIRKLLINQGVRVFMLPIPDMPANELSGLSWWHEAYGPCILLNSKNNSGRRSFTLAHEYAHLLCDDTPTVCAYMLDVPEEHFANQFAAILLMPDEDLRKSFIEMVGPYVESPSDQDLGKLAARYGVSLEAMGRGLEALGLIPRGVTDSRIAEWEKRPQYYRGKRGSIWKRQLGDEFISLALQAHSEGHISVSKLSQYFGQDVRTVMRELEESKHK